jgi:hypothetical protein
MAVAGRLYVFTFFFWYKYTMNDSLPSPNPRHAVSVLRSVRNRVAPKQCVQLGDHELASGD